MSKRLKAADNSTSDLQRRADDATGELQSSRMEIQRLSAELARARAAYDDLVAKQEAASRDSKQLQG